MRWMLETTDWGNESVPNHIYCLTDNKENMIAYIRLPITEPKVFKKPIRFDMRGRTFKEIPGPKSPKA